MITDTDAIVLRQVKTVNADVCCCCFRRNTARSASAAILTRAARTIRAATQRPFTYGHYELFKGRESYNLNRGQVIKSYYGIEKTLTNTWRHPMCWN